MTGMEKAKISRLSPGRLRRNAAELTPEQEEILRQKRLAKIYRKMKRQSGKKKLNRSTAGNAYMIWNLILTGDRYGYLNGILLRTGILNEPILWMQTEKFVMPVLIVVQLWLSLGTGFLSFIAGLQTVDKGLYEAAAIDGVKNRWQELWFVTLPAMKAKSSSPYITRYV